MNTAVFGTPPVELFRLQVGTIVAHTIRYHSLSQHSSRQHHGISCTVSHLGQFGGFCIKVQSVGEFGSGLKKDYMYDTLCCVLWIEIL